MNRFAILALIIASSIIASGCIQGKIRKPEIRGINHKWGSVTNETTEIITEITVYNPNPFPLPLKDIRTEIYMNGIKMGGEICSEV